MKTNFTNTTLYYWNTTVSGALQNSSGHLRFCHGERHSVDFIPAFIYVVVLFIFGVPGNTLVCYVYTKTWVRKRKSFYLLILCLGILDLSNCIFTLPFEMVLLMNAFDFDSPIFCKILRTLTYSINVLSGVVHLAIGVDRLLGICCWHRVNPRSVTHVYVSLAFGCVFALLTCWPPPFLYGTRTYHLSSKVVMKTCSVSDYYATSIFPFILGMYLLISNIVVDCILIGLYLVVGIYIFRQNQQTVNRFRDSVRNLCNLELVQKQGNESPSTPDVSRNSRDSCTLPETYRIVRTGNTFQARKTTLMLFVITLVYILTFIPYCVIILRRYFGEDRLQNFLCDSFTQRNIIQIIKRSYLLSMAIDPLVYCFMSNQFRKECKELFRRSSFFLFRRKYK